MIRICSRSGWTTAAIATTAGVLLSVTTAFAEMQFDTPDLALTA
jgi:hypothetical protein